jgi:hypothetical protein
MFCWPAKVTLLLCLKVELSGNASGRTFLNPEAPASLRLIRPSSYSPNSLQL